MTSNCIFHSLDAVQVGSRPVHLAIGMFDGFHLGHQSVVEAAIHSAHRAAGLAGVLTFWPHPSRLLRPNDPTPQIMDPEEKATVLLESGVDFVVVHPFSAEFASLEAVDFLPFVQERIQTLNTVYVGENWRFGRRRTGDVAFLVENARKAGIGVFSAPRVKLNGEPISSTRVRGHLLKGEIAEANRLLGAGYETRGVVRGGRQLGRRLGFPTLNLDWVAELKPAFGVYSVRVRSADRSQVRDGIANFGMRPTLELSGEAPRLEVHVLGDCPWRPGDALRVEWLDFIREERKFADLDGLKEQVARDIAELQSRIERA